MDRIVSRRCAPPCRSLKKMSGSLKGSAGKNIYKFFSRDRKEKCSSGRAGQLAAAGAAANACAGAVTRPMAFKTANCYASSKMQNTALFGEAGSGPFLGTRTGGLFQPHAASGATARSAGARDISRIGCSTPWCTRSDSGAGGGRPADAAQEVSFPRSREPGELQQRGASERSAWPPPERRTQGDAASIGCSTPLFVILAGRGDPRDAGF